MSGADSVLPPAIGLVADRAAAVAADIDRLFDLLLAVPEDPRARLYEAMRHAAMGGGKRLRPLLVQAASDLFNISRVSALRVGLAVECIHVYSLVHDDLPAMDDDDLRRGKPTVHKAFDEATAILAGDCLHDLAFEVLADEETHPDPFVRVELVKALALASGTSGMAGGQMMDLEAEKTSFDLPTVMPTRLFGTLRGTIALSVHDEDGAARVAWAPHLRLPIRPGSGSTRTAGPSASSPAARTCVR